MAASADSPILPVSPETFTYEGEAYDVYQVPTEDGVIHQWALVKKGRQTSQFVDPANPEAGLIDWTGNWRQLQVNNAVDLHPENFANCLGIC